MFAHSEPAGGPPARPWPAINNSQAIYDPFLGSGKSLIAAEMTGRVYYAVRRRQVFTGRAAMHQASGQSFDERAGRQDHNQSGVAHGAKTIHRD